ncbi:hypothetical protein AMJ83_09055 [candidate division WOR_3 bacterium SM23_42]|uniref:Sialidase domain-containing protein n=1 Tax=candidate division WOR_3 bacterium SM23_42 TaxID=1703779 RepID=A0A0S8FS67_UNCW3|nr:MAG: hypothetical protein AMJ83_09055 [candidate division WOR_3 bacterium SM23_42]
MLSVIFVAALIASLTSVTSHSHKREYMDDQTNCIATHRVLPQRQGNAVLVDSGTPYSAWTNIQHCLAFDPITSGLQFVCRNYDPTGHINVHQTNAAFSLWVHDMQIYQAEYGNARYPASIASPDGPYICFPFLNPLTGTWGSVCAQYEEGGWYSSFWAYPVDLGGGIGSPKSIGAELPTGDLVFVLYNVDHTISYYTMSADLNNTVASGILASNCQIWGIDCNGGICYVFWYDLTDLSVWYRTTTDGIDWSFAAHWALTYPTPFTHNVLFMPQMAVTDEGDPMLIFDLYDLDDASFPYNAKTYVSTASSDTSIQVSDDSYATSWYPTIAAGSEIVILMHVWTNGLEDSLARHDLFIRASSDNGNSWSLPVNLTENEPNRPGLAQLAKRFDPVGRNLCYFYGIDLVVDWDILWQIFFDMYR